MERLTHQGEHGPYWDKAVFDKHGGMEEDLIIDRLAYYEDMEEQGRLVVLPCKVGDTVYRKLTLTCQKETVIVIGLDDEGIYIGTTCGTYRKHDFGKTVFLTREEAENALKGLTKD